MITKPVQLTSKTVQVPHRVPRYYHGSIQTQNQSKWLINVNVNQRHDRKDLIDLMIKAYFTIYPNYIAVIWQNKKFTVSDCIDHCEVVVGQPVVVVVGVADDDEMDQRHVTDAVHLVFEDLITILAQN